MLIEDKSRTVCDLKSVTPKPKQIDEWDAKFAACSQCGLRVLTSLVKSFVYILSSKLRYVWKLRLRFENVGEERKNFCELLN